MKRTAIALSVLFVLDLGYAGQGLFSMLVSVAGVCVLTAGAIASRVRGAGPLARSRAMRACLYLMLGVDTLGITRFHRATSEANAARIIDACRAFDARYGTLPNRLQDLVPEFLPDVPRAKYTLAYNAFEYSTFDEHRHTLMYVAFPPFGRRIYHFEGRRWSQLD
jgi:hypothetical protein